MIMYEVVEAKTDFLMILTVGIRIFTGSVFMRTEFLKDGFEKSEDLIFF